MAKKDLKQEIDNDSVWKELLEKYLVEFMTFFFPQASSQIDWERGYKFLDKELQKVVRQATEKRRYVDKLVQVWLKNGQESWVLLHIEVQAQWEELFAERMYIYQYRIYDRYRKKVASFVVLADENPNWRPDKFTYELLGSKQLWEYQIVKLLDYQSKWLDLEKEINPFSLVVMAHLKLQETKNNSIERYNWKKFLIKMLYEKGYSKENVLELFRFLDWLIVLPEDLAQKLDDEIEEFERTNLMPYVTHIERRGIEKGLLQGLELGKQEGLELGKQEGLELGKQEGLELGKQEGLELGKQEEASYLILKQLARKCGKLEQPLLEKVQQLTVQQLEDLGEALLDFQTNSDLVKWLAAINSK